MRCCLGSAPPDWWYQHRVTDTNSSVPRTLEDYAKRTHLRRDGCRYETVLLEGGPIVGEKALEDAVRPKTVR